MDSIAYKIQQFRKDIRPAMRCFHPLRVYNKVTCEFEYHNCGHCPYCLSLKATELATRCFNECKQHKYAIFFTLTYDNESVPYIAPSPTGKYWYLVNRTVKSVDGLSVPIVHFDVMDIPGNKVLETANGPVDIAAFGVVHLPDIQRFQKRLRIKINRQFNHYDPKKQKQLYDLRQKEISIRPLLTPNMVQPHSVRIITGFAGLTQKRLRTLSLIPLEDLEERTIVPVGTVLYMKVGRCLILRDAMPNMSPIPLQTMLRNTLLALLICLRFYDLNLFAPSAWVLKIRLSALIRSTIKNLQTLSIMQLWNLVDGMMKQKTLSLLYFPTKLCLDSSLGVSHMTYRMIMINYAYLKNMTV